MNLVSIIMPVYNMADSLEKSIESVLKQDYENIEVILVDDGSTDHTLEICNRIAADDNRVKVIHTENQGSGPARNEGIRAAKGDYLYFPDADDYLYPHTISTLVKAITEDDYDLVVFGYRVETHDGALVSEKIFDAFHKSGQEIRADYSDYIGMAQKYGIQGAPWNKFFRADVVRKYSLQFPPLRRHQDEGFISRYVNCCEHVRFISDVLYIYYQNTITMEWKKYPADYKDAVMGLNQIWQETICTWNKEDHATHLLVKKMIYTKLMKALEFSFSPKMKMNFGERRKWIKQLCIDAQIEEYPVEATASRYQRLVLFGIKKHLYTLVMATLYMGFLRKSKT